MAEQDTAAGDQHPPGEESTSLKDFEGSVKRLEEIVSSLDDQELSLDEALKLFQEGLTVFRKCTGMAETVRARVEKLVEHSPGSFILEAFDQPDGDDDSGE